MAEGQFRLSDNETEEQGGIYSYASLHWISHIQAPEGGKEIDCNLAIQLKTFLGSPMESSPQYRQWHGQAAPIARGNHGLVTLETLKETSSKSAAILAMCRFSLYTLLADWWDNAIIDISQTNTNGDSVLVLSARAGCKPICEVLLNRGLDVNKTRERSIYGSALAAAVYAGSDETVEFLIKRVQM